MAKLYSSHAGQWRGSYEESAYFNFQAVGHVMHEERTLRELRLVVPAGWRIVDAYVLDRDLDKLRFLDVSVVVESRAQIDDSYTNDCFAAQSLRVTALPGSLIAPQHPPPTWNAPPSAWEHVTETVVWLPPGEEAEDFLPCVERLYDESWCDVAEDQVFTPRASRVLKGFGGCRFVARDGMYCIDCNQLIVYGKKCLDVYREHKSFCVRCKGKSGIHYVRAIEVRKQGRERRKSAVGDASEEA